MFNCKLYKQVVIIFENICLIIASRGPKIVYVIVITAFVVPRYDVYAIWFIYFRPIKKCLRFRENNNRFSHFQF